MFMRYRRVGIHTSFARPLACLFLSNYLLVKASSEQLTSLTHF